MSANYVVIGATTNKNIHFIPQNTAFPLRSEVMQNSNLRILASLQSRLIVLNKMSTFHDINIEVKHS